MKPPLWTVVALGLSSLGMVWSYAQGNLNAQYLWWIAAFLVMEVYGQIRKEPGATLTERFRAWLGIQPRRPNRWHRAPFAGLFTFDLGFHFMLDKGTWWCGGTAVVITALPLTIIVIKALWEGRNADV